MSWRCRMSALMWSNGWRAQGNQSVESSATLRCGEEVGQMRPLMSALKRGGPGAPPELLQARRVAYVVMLRHGSFLEKAEIFDHSFFGITAKQAAFSCLIHSLAPRLAPIGVFRSGACPFRRGDVPSTSSKHAEVGFGSWLRSALRLRRGSRDGFRSYLAARRLHQDVAETVEGRRPRDGLGS